MIKDTARMSDEQNIHYYNTITIIIYDIQEISSLRPQFTAVILQMVAPNRNWSFAPVMGTICH